MDDPVRLQSGGHEWLHICTNSPSIPTTRYKRAKVASLPPEIWSTFGAYVDDALDAQICSLVCVDWARGCRSEGCKWEICIHSREDMELFVKFTQRRSRFPRLVDFISGLWIFQDASLPLWFDLLGHIRSDPVLARRVQSAPDRNRPALEIVLNIWGDQYTIKPLHPSIARSLPWSIHSAAARFRLVWIRNIQLGSLLELRRITAAARSSAVIGLDRVIWNVATVSPLPSSLSVMSPGNQLPDIRPRACTSNILVALAAFSSLASCQELGRQSSYRCIPLSEVDQDIICTVLTNIFGDAEWTDLKLDRAGYGNGTCTFVDLDCICACIC